MSLPGLADFLREGLWRRPHTLVGAVDHASESQRPQLELGAEPGLPNSLWTTSLLSSPLTLASAMVIVGTVVVLFVPFPSHNQLTLLAW